ncbi:MAG: hypothetical protein GXO98_07770 [Nitrospirae bacterium]|nr:hypothetical protein [Nitrospirota bacterium]
MQKFRIAREIVLGIAFIFLLSGFSPPSPANIINVPARDEAFTFVVIGDNRPGGRGDKVTQPPIFYRAINEINLLDPDFVVILGDLVWGYTADKNLISRMWDGFDAAVAKFKVPYFLVLGNHDVSNATMQQVYLERYGDRFPQFYSFDYKGYHFIILDSDYPWEQRNNKSITGKQLAWLKKDLVRHQGAKKTFVFLHKPLWSNSRSNWLKEVHPLLAKYGVDTVFAGHAHLYTKDPTRDGVRYLVSGGGGAGMSESEFTGSFFHYLMITVRGDKISTAVVRTGYIENEEIVNEALLKKVRALLSPLQPLRLRLEKGATRLPQQLEIVIANPFQEKISGSLVWEIPPGSPWQVPETRVEISVEPGQKQRLVLPTPPGSSLTNIEALNPLPVGIWNLSVGGRTLWKERRAAVIIDQWPYTKVKTALKQALSINGAKKIVAGPKVSALLQIPQKNTSAWPIAEVLSWRFPRGSRWAISPASQTVTLAPGEKKKVTFKVSFTGTPEEIFPLPKMDSVVLMEGKKILQSSARLPIEAKKYFSQVTRVAEAIRVQAGPKLDGKLNDPAWKKSSVVANFLLPNANGSTNYPTEVRLVYDNKNLYLSFRCLEPNLPGLVTEVKERDGPIWRDDSIEIFLDTNLDKKTYYHLAINADAVIYDGWGQDRSWNGTYLAQAGREAGAWTLEVAIPWKTIGITSPKTGMKMGLELARTRAQNPREKTLWSPTFGGFHTPSRFGVLILK